MRNKYVNRAKISEAKFRELVKFFSLDLTAMQIAELTGLNRNTVNRYLTEIRRKIANYSRFTSPVKNKKLPSYNIESYDNFSILVREFETKIYTDIIPTTLIFKDDELIKSDFFKRAGYELVINLETEKHLFIGDKNDQSQTYRIKLNRIESFWGSAKSRLTKFKGMHNSTFKYHVNECEFRFNNREKDLYQLLLKILRKDPLF